MTINPDFEVDGYSVDPNTRTAASVARFIWEASFSTACYRPVSAYTAAAAEFRILLSLGALCLARENGDKLYIIPSFPLLVFGLRLDRVGREGGRLSRGTWHFYQQH